MKIWQILLFLMCINAAFYLLSLTGLYFSNPSSDYNVYTEWSGAQITMLTATTFVTGATVGLFLARFGVNPFTSAAYGAFLGMFVVTYGGFLKILYSIGTMMGPAKLLMDGFLVILTMVMGVLMLYSCIQMATGGAKSFE